MTKSLNKWGSQKNTVKIYLINNNTDRQSHLQKMQVLPALYFLGNCSFCMW